LAQFLLDSTENELWKLSHTLLHTIPPLYADETFLSYPPTPPPSEFFSSLCHVTVTRRGTPASRESWKWNRTGVTGSTRDRIQIEFKTGASKPGAGAPAGSRAQSPSHGLDGTGTSLIACGCHSATSHGSRFSKKKNLAWKPPTRARCAHTGDWRPVNQSCMDLLHFGGAHERMEIDSDISDILSVFLFLIQFSSFK
jgi:hypothetical protein